MVDKTSTGVWLLHSTPQFPFRRDPNHFWPSSGEKHAQTFICVTFPYNQFSHIGNELSYKTLYIYTFVLELNVTECVTLFSGSHLQYIGAFPFEHDVPADFHQELKDAVNWVQRPPSNNFQPLTSTDPSGAYTFYSIAKQESTQPKGEMSACLFKSHYLK